MKKLLFIFSFLLTFIIIDGQGLLPGVVSSQSGGSYCDEYQAVYDAMTDPPASDTAAAQNTMVSALVDGGYWTRMDLFYLLANGRLANSKLEWVSAGVSYTLAEVAGGGALSFTVYEGWTGDGTAYFNTAFNPNTSGVVSQNDVSVGGYIRTDQDGSNKYVMGAYDGTYLTFTTRNGTSVYYRVNTGSAPSVGSQATAIGHWLASRTGANVEELFKNGVSVDTDTNASTGVPNALFSLFALTSLGPVSVQLSIAYLMDGTNVTDAAAINTILETYMDFLGKGIQ